MKRTIASILVAIFAAAILAACVPYKDPYAGMDYCDRPDVDKYTDGQCLGGREIPVKNDEQRTW